MAVTVRPMESVAVRGVRIWLCLGGLWLAGLALPAAASVEKDFLAAREAYAKGRMSQFLKQAARFPADHLLSPYIRYWQLKSNNPGPAEMLAFIEQHPDTPLSDRLRQDLVRRLAQSGDWQGVLDQAGRLAKTDAETRCHGYRARLALGDAAAERPAAESYLTPRDLPSACEPLFAELFARGALTQEERYTRLRLALETGNLRLARELDARLPEDERMRPDALTRAQQSPAGLVAEASPRRAQREAALYALGQVARTDPAAAARLWESHLASYAEDERRHGWGQIALAAARRHDPNALDWFARAGEQLTEFQRLWKTRAALRAGRWLEVFYSINAMPEAMQEEAVWRYWKARALKALGSGFAANALFARLSTEHHYYGLLAEEELPARLEPRPADHRLTPAELAAAEANPGLQRALLLRRLNLGTNAAEEWEWALRGMGDQQLLAAAEIASREKWYDRAIVTAEKTRELHDFGLRYMTPYRDLAETYAGRQGLDPAWVYGLMRQESRFVDYARSGAGALGLMQIMPATAQWIAGQLGLDRKRAHAAVKEPETNIRFGTYYLKHIHDSLGRSAVMATAGYNAGPGRARRWQADSPLEGAVYVESIPYLETREYVKKVLANAVHYSHRFGTPTSLKARLGIIPPRASAPAGGDDAAPGPADQP